MTQDERKALLGCRNMLTHVLLLSEIPVFDKNNIMKRIDAADAVLFDGGYEDSDARGYNI